MSRSDIWQELIDIAIARNWTVKLTSKCHLHFISPDGRSVFGPGTSGDIRSIHRVRTKLRRAGLEF